MRLLAALALVATAACGGSASGTAAPRPAPALEVGADYRTYRRVTDGPYLSTVHGGRWVHVFVNAIGADAYVSGAPIPVGTIVVKESWEAAGDRPSNVPGPLFVMQKRAPGYAPDHGDWWYALYWPDPPPAQRAKFGGPIYWSGTSPRVEYCSDCHDAYDRGLGGLVPSSVLQR